ncbi:hypothetical protein P152DRAFT_391328 [Eremomyces bilateralis CBS 781.70]|uniref:N-acetylgalactosaminide beta-1,3-galactosyltransferase n=1 Tax=Eremomyces bilateralis CBS 781.70 TaxID=1392243 RepID=A0A6G1GAC9_9PEZI|nr:uncharacterized protein P152DRAFT_391328 [Eremomyces bilateralis CBS 781.70]KAF1814962.1 hypothetical protein P152DRAFT_391328 [Eremomyces bilateralis CBS 781.70]
MLPSRRGHFPAIRVLGALVAFVFVYTSLSRVFHGSRSRNAPVSLSPLRFGSNDTAHRPCPYIPGLDDVLVVMKTGSSEADTKLPWHFSTTFRCVPHHFIVSDLEESIQGYDLHDALRDVSPAIRKDVPEMELYNNLREHGRKALDDYDFTKYTQSKQAKKDGRENPAHKLDKWKFLPMAHQAYQHRPAAKWYVFMEADTYLSWSNVMKWLNNFDASKPQYLGSQMQIGETIFAFGGTGFAISNPAMKELVDYRSRHLGDLEEYTKNGWAGDEILGHVLGDMGVKLVWGYPNSQMSLPQELSYTEAEYDKRLWCYAPIGWHRVDSEDIDALYSFDLTFNHNKSLLLHSDMFNQYVLPQIEAAPERDDWENLAEEVHGIGPDSPHVRTAAACRSLCMKDKNCKQYTYGHGICRTSSSVRLGEPVARSSPQLWLPTHSGWIVNRVRAFSKKMPACREGPWVLS